MVQGFLQNPVPAQLLQGRLAAAEGNGQRSYDPAVLLIDLAKDASAAAVQNGFGPGIYAAGQLEGRACTSDRRCFPGTHTVR